MMQQGMRRLGAVAGMLAAVAVWVPGVAQAVPVTYEFSGTVGNVSSPLASAAVIGNTFWGSFTYDTDAAPSRTNNLGAPLYENSASVGAQVGDILVTSGGFTAILIGNNTANAPFDTFRFGSRVSGTGVNGYVPFYFNLNLTDTSGAMLVSDALPTDLPLPSFSQYGPYSSVDIIFANSITGELSASIQSNITSLTRVGSVPEPSSLLLLGSGLAGVILFRRKLAV